MPRGGGDVAYNIFPFARRAPEKRERTELAAGAAGNPTAPKDKPSPHHVEWKKRAPL